MIPANLVTEYSTLTTASDYVSLMRKKELLNDASTHAQTENEYIWLYKNCEKLANQSINYADNKFADKDLLNLAYFYAKNAANFNTANYDTNIWLEN